MDSIHIKQSISKLYIKSFNVLLHAKKPKTVFDFNLFFPSVYKKNIFGLILEVILDPISTRRETKIQVKITKKKTDGKICQRAEKLTTDGHAGESSGETGNH